MRALRWVFLLLIVLAGCQAQEEPPNEAAEPEGGEWEILFDGVSFAGFIRDLRRKNWVLLLEDRLAVLLHLFRRFQIPLVCPLVVIFAIVGRIVTADFRPGLVDPAALIVTQMLALRVHQQIPVLVFREDRRSFARQVQLR